MRRRDFVILFGLAVITPQAVLAQATGKRSRIGWLSYAAKDTPIGVRYLEQFLTGMRDLGYVEDRDFEMLYRFADFHADRCPNSP
jgi:putative tryptophan/tyrosine transport system substrate-binding protein